MLPSAPGNRWVITPQPESAGAYQAPDTTASGTCATGSSGSDAPGRSQTVQREVHAQQRARFARRPSGQLLTGVSAMLPATLPTIPAGVDSARQRVGRRLEIGALQPQPVDRIALVVGVESAKQQRSARQIRARGRCACGRTTS